ncbi:MAG: hypothetical protein ACO1Q7_06715 [Gemmatimonas sp.]
MHQEGKRAAGTTGSSISIPTKLLATAVACAAAVLVCGTAATVVVATDVTHRLNRNQQTYADAAAGRPPKPAGSFRDRGATAVALDSLVAPLGPLTPLSPSDAGAIASLSAGGSTRETWASVSAAGPAKLPAAIPDSLRWRRSRPLHRDSLNAVERAALPAALRDPWLPVFRAWARSPRETALFDYRPGMPGVRDVRDLPPRSFAVWRTLFAENELASLDALWNGHGKQALTHARENVAAARHFAEQPVIIDAMLGRIFLNRALFVLEHVARESGDMALADRVRSLNVGSRSLQGATSMRALWAIEADPNAHAAEAWAADTTLHPALRVGALSYIALGGCRNARELMIGFSGERTRSMRRAVASIHDIERGEELGTLHEKFLEYAMNLRDAPEKDSRRSILGRNELMGAFAWMVPPGVRARASLCLAQSF